MRRNTARPIAQLAAAAAALLLIAHQASAQTPAQTPAYVGSDSCSDCHADATEAWTGSHHDLAWTETGEIVLGDFADTVFEHDGTRTEFSQGDGRYRIRVTERDGVTTDYDIHSVAGIAPLQQYLLDIGDGRVQSFDVVWDTEEARWYHLYPDQTLDPDDGLHWSGPYKSWNARCAECHATGFEKAYDPRSRSYASREAEIGVGCEACHGPGEAHLDWARTGTRPADRFAGLTDIGLTLSYASGDAETEIQQCATCHARREPFLDGNPLPGTPFHDAFRLALLRPGLYHADGTILEEVYVYGSFLQSKMYDRGVQCSDCHEVHSAGLVADGNAVCTQCHSPAGNPDFPTLTRADYDTPDHHFHPEDSEGAACKSCHMIERVYMGVDWRRDHSFRIPRPDLAAETGAPDACTDCHTDQTPVWAAGIIAGWFPDDRNRGPHFGTVLARGWADPAGARGALLDAALDGSLPAIARASVIETLLPASDPALAARAASLLDDDSPLVRAAAASLQRAAELPDRARRLAPLLGDPVAAVRIAAARELLGVSPSDLPAREGRALQEALQEWQRALVNKADFPETHLVLGGAALVLRDPPSALRAFAEAVRLDPEMSQAWVMLMRINLAIGDIPAARAARNAALAAVPEDPVVQDIARSVP